MPSMKAIKRRISSVTNTQQIIKAMDLVAVSKLQKLKGQLNSIRPLFNETKRVVDNLKNCEGVEDNVFFKPREVKNTAYIVITSDRGMCGAYNTNISKHALEHMKDCKNEKIIAVGSKGRDFFKRRKKNITRKFIGVSETALNGYAQDISRLISNMYISGEIDEAYVAYTQFETVLSQKPKVVKILPLGSETESNDYNFEMRCDPNLNTVLDCVVPLYLNSYIYGAMVESSVCEESSRMISMDAASNNAEEIIDDLKLEYNRMRQGAITQEINEIVSGANAMS